jgi:hypothetical protein
MLACIERKREAAITSCAPAMVKFWERTSNFSFVVHLLPSIGNGILLLVGFRGMAWRMLVLLFLVMVATADLMRMCNGIYAI